MSCPQNRQSAHNHPSPSRPFLRKQESHSVVSAQSPNPPTIPVPHKTIPAKAGISQCRIRTIANPPTITRPQVDHSCESRNLTVSYPHNHQIRQQSPVPKQTIPAKAGISQCHIRTIDKSDNNPPSPSRPFLRKQESYSVVSAQSPNPPTIPRPPQDHSCVGRNLSFICRQRRHLLGGGQLAAYFANIYTRHCEIPAFAGMVSGRSRNVFYLSEPIAVIDSCRCRVAVCVRICRQYPFVYGITNLGV